jgi:hypothetical protein
LLNVLFLGQWLMHQPGHVESASGVPVTGGIAGASVSGYLQKNYHIADGNLYSVLTPSTQTDKNNKGSKSR